MSEELNEIQNRIATLKKRREDMESELDQATADSKTHKQAASDALLAGRDAGSNLNASALAEAKVEALKGAIELANNQVRALEVDYNNKTRQAAIDAYETQVVANARKTLTKDLRLLYEIAEDLDKIGLGLGNPAGVSDYFSDESIAVKNLLTGLHNFKIGTFLEGLERADYYNGGRNGAFEIARARKRPLGWANPGPR